MTAEEPGRRPGNSNGQTPPKQDDGARAQGVSEKARLKSGGKSNAATKAGDGVSKSATGGPRASREKGNETGRGTNSTNSFVIEGPELDARGGAGK